MADASHSKCDGGDPVRVRIPLPAPITRQFNDLEIIHRLWAVLAGLGAVQHLNRREHCLVNRRETTEQLRPLIAVDADRAFDSPNQQLRSTPDSGEWIQEIMAQQIKGFLRQAVMLIVRLRHAPSRSAGLASQ